MPAMVGEPRTPLFATRIQTAQSKKTTGNRHTLLPAREIRPIRGFEIELGKTAQNEIDESLYVLNHEAAYLFFLESK